MNNFPWTWEIAIAKRQVKYTQLGLQWDLSTVHLDSNSNMIKARVLPVSMYF